MDAESTLFARAASNLAGQPLTARSSVPKRDDSRVKVTLRLPREAAAILAERAEAAGVPRGDYFAAVLHGTPVPPVPVDHHRCLEALGLSTDGLAAVAKDLNALMRLNSDKSIPTTVDKFFHRMAVDSALEAHLHVASQLLGHLKEEAAQRSRALRPTKRDSEA